MSKKSASGLVAWAEEAYKNKWVYWYGTCGYACESGLLSRKTKQYPDHYKESRQPTYKKHIAAGRVCADCIGLFKSYAWDEDGDIDTRKSDYGSNDQPDQGAKTTLSKCKVKGSIDTIPEIPGIAVWTKTGGHIGLYVGNGEVIELRGFAYGCQRNKLSKRAFTTWGLYPYVEYTPEQTEMALQAANSGKADNSTIKTETPEKAEKTSKTESVVYDMKTLRVGNKGTQVMVLQWLLNHTTDYTSGKVDGIFGTKTLAAVRQYQQANGLTVDGVVGKNTWKKLLG